MNKHITTLIIGFLLAGMHATAQSPTPKKEQGGTIFFDETKYSFGVIEESNGRVSKTFTFRNISSQYPIKIISVETGCGCTVPEYPKGLIYPEKSGDITVTFDPKDRPGDFSKMITVKTNGKPEYVYLEITGKVENESTRLYRSFPVAQGNAKLSDALLKFNLKDNQSDSMVVSMLNASRKVLYISTIKSPAHIRVEPLKKSLLPNEVTPIKITYYPQIAMDYGTRNDEIYIQTTDDSVSVKTILIKADINQDFSSLTPEQLKNAPKAILDKTEHDFGEVFLGEEVVYTLTITNKGKSDLIIKKVKADCGCIVGAYTKDVIKKGKKGTIQIKLNTKGMRWNVAKSVQIYLNDPKNSIVTIRLKARVVIPGIDATTTDK